MQIKIAAVDHYGRAAATTPRYGDPRRPASCAVSCAASIRSFLDPDQFDQGAADDSEGLKKLMWKQCLRKGLRS
jgi:hypothetical protein